jgi:hypothetical protein
MIMVGVVGVLATIVMLVFFEIIRKTTSVDVIRSLGAMFTQNEDNAFVPGVVLSLVYGIIFSYIYVLIFSFIPRLAVGNPAVVRAALGMGLGFNHGMIAALATGMFLSIHPVEKFRSQRIGIAIVNAFGHIIYGIIVGILV